MKKCTLCQQVKCFDDFSNKKSSKDGKNARCKICTRLATKLHYENNKDYYVGKARVNNKRVSDWFRDYKQGLSCSLCGEDRWWVLDFHHKESSSKDYNVATLSNMGSIYKLKKEIKKCVPICANCHRDLHYNKKNT